MKRGPYVIQNAATGNFYRVQQPGERHGTWHDFAIDATAFDCRHSADQALAALRAKFTRLNRGGLGVVERAQCPVASGCLFQEARP